jgi:uncharacterized SAM-binding protein YcdF (DUF218 family)
MKVRRLLKTLFSILLVGFLALVVAFGALCVAVDRYGRSDRAQPADVIVILGAKVLPNGEPGPDLSPRVEKAALLYKQGYAPYVVCTGGAAGDRMSAAAIAQRAATAAGVPAGASIIADGTSSTRQDAERTADVLAARGWSSALVVTHPLHLLRATVLFRRAGIDAYPSPTTTRVEEIAPRWRAFYAVREAVLLTFDVISTDGQMPAWMLDVQRWLRVAGLDEID